MTELKLYRCLHCGNIVEKIYDAKVPVVCCGEKMQELVANTTEAAHEKHLPVVEIEGDIATVTVGSVTHPMEEVHHIQFIFLQTEDGMMRVQLKPGEAPVAKFALNGKKPIAAYEYCTLHGLWKTEL